MRLNTAMHKPTENMDFWLVIKPANIRVIPQLRNILWASVMAVAVYRKLPGSTGGSFA